jgi:hypothetical protein
MIIIEVSGMITTTTLHVNYSEALSFLPAFWRLGKLATGLPVLWPMTYQQAVIVECSAKSQSDACRLVENCLLLLLKTTPAHQLHITVYEHSLRSPFPALKSFTQQPSKSLVNIITQKKHVKDYLGELQQKAHQRQALLAKLQVATWYEYMAMNHHAEPLEVLVLSQLWPDIELLGDLADVCQYGVRLGILPILIVSSRYFPKVPHDEWQINLSGVLEEITTNSLGLLVHQDASLEIKHQQLQEIANLYQFFKPTVDHNDVVV